MASLLLVRRPDDWGGRIRRLKVVVDGRVGAELLPNEEATIELGAGTHIVTGKIDWARSKELSVDVNEVHPATVEVSLPYSAVFESFIRPSRAVKVRLLN